MTCLALFALGSCSAGSTVEYIDGQCVIDGSSVSLEQVEARQADVTQHILSRQPILTAIAVAAVMLAIAGYLQRLLTILAARRAGDENLGERIRRRMQRYRAHPVRYFLLLTGVLGLLVLAGVAYVSMDADKRASERSLASLQFCHLALRSAEEQRVLAEQREHLASIQSTARDIQALVGTLPPAEQEKAKEIAQQLSTSLGQQRTMVAQFAQHADVAAHAVAEHQAQVEQSLSKLDGDVGDLKSVPVAVSKLASVVTDVAARQQALGGELEACIAHDGTVDNDLAAVAKQLDALAARPPPTCSCPATPAAQAAAPKTVPPATAAAGGSASPPPPPAPPPPSVDAGAG
nr:hypothetical protein [Kofleriaceae bacterium]